MKIGFEAQRLFRAHKHGMDFVALELIKALQYLDKENEYIIYINKGDDPCIEETDNFKIKVFGGTYPIWEQKLLPQMALRDKVDLLHCTSNTAPMSCPVPLVVTLHDVIYLENNPLFAPGYTPYQRFGNVYRRFVVQRAIPKANKILTVSKYEVDNVLKFFPQIKDKLQVLYNGVGKHFQVISNPNYLAEIATKYNLPKKFVMFLGNTDPKKNTANTLEAYGLFAREDKFVHKLVLGDLNREFVMNILKEGKMEDVFEHIHFTGYIKNAELPAIITQAAAFLYPSNRESFGIPVIEAMACGTPVVTSNVTSMPEVAGDAAILVDPKNPKQIEDAIKKLVYDQNLRTQLIPKGLDQAKKFDWDESAKKLIQIYKEIVTQK